MYGELIRAARKKKGWTQSDLAYKLGINPVGIVQWEQNRRNPKFETRQKIARALDIDITELMLLSEKEDYEKKHGDCESRINFAVYEYGFIFWQTLYQFSKLNNRLPIYLYFPYR